MRLQRDFFAQHTVDVAKNLLGKTLQVGSRWGVITETEAYRGIDDAASHAYCGPTKRSAIMFGPPGYVYVYLIYGVYFCLNIVTEDLGDPGAVLIRGVVTPQSHLNGPGKICREFGITKEFNGLNLSESAVMSVMPGKCSEPFYATPRIGIRKAQDKLWRFVLPVSHQQVS